MTENLKRMRLLKEESIIRVQRPARQILQMAHLSIITERKLVFHQLEGLRSRVAQLEPPRAVDRQLAFS